MAKQQEESAGLSDKERAALERAQAAEQRAAQLEREQQKRAKDDEQKQAQRDEAQTKQEGLVKVGELMKGLKGLRRALVSRRIIELKGSPVGSLPTRLKTVAVPRSAMT